MNSIGSTGSAALSAASSSPEAKALEKAQAQLRADKASNAAEDVIKADETAVEAAQAAVDQANKVSVTGSILDTRA